MVIDNIVENMEKEGKKGKKTTKKATKTEETKSAVKSTKKEDNNLFNLVIAVVVILGIIGIVFGYTKDKISEIKKGGTEASKGLEVQVQTLQQQLADLKQKADDLEKAHLENKLVVLDLFDKNRVIPDKVNVADWNSVDNKKLGFTVSYPKSWEQVKVLDETKVEENALYLQPIGQVDYLNALTIKADYADFADLSMSEKMDIFGELDTIDSKDFKRGKLIYFINLDKDNNEIPTILILTDDNIYRATFNVHNRKLLNYFEYRKNFEEIVSTFGLAVIETDVKTEEPVETAE